MRSFKNIQWAGLKSALPLVMLNIVVLLGLMVAYQVRQPLGLDIGRSFARAHLRGFFADEKLAATTYAYTQEHSAIWLPGVGADSALVSLALSGWRPDGVQPAQMRVAAGDHSVTIQPRTYPATYHLFMPPTNGDLTLHLASNVYPPGGQDRRLLGLPLDAVQVQAFGSRLPLTTAGWLMLLATGLWLLGLRLGLSGWQAALAAGTVALGLVVGLAQARLFVAVGLGRLVATLLLLHLLLWPLQTLLRRVLVASKLEWSAAGWRWLWGIFALAFLVRVGGVLYPHTIIFDQAAHTLRVQRVLDGRFAELYYPSFTSFMGVTVGIEGGHFPYSPLWYLIVTPLTWIGLAIGDAMNGLNAVLDTTKLLLIYLVALVTIARERVALLAAALYGLLLMPFYLLSWGNYPTQLGLWAALLATTYLVLHYAEPWSRRTFATWVALLVLAILSYTVLGIFLCTMLVFLLFFELLRKHQPRRQIVQRLLVGMLLAELCAFGLYHVHFVAEIAQNTLPALFASVETKASTELRADVDPRASPLSNLTANNTFLRNHTTAGLLIIALLGTVLLYVDPLSRRWWPLWTAWLGIFVFYTAISALVADMVLKHIFYVMPLICLAGALVLEWLWVRWRAGRWLVWATLLVLAGLASERWYEYMLIKRHY